MRKLFAISSRLLCIICITFFSVHDLRADNQNDLWSDLINVLSAKQVNASLEKSLLNKYHVSLNQAGGFIEINNCFFTQNQFPVLMNSSEEWPPAMGGTSYLLKDPTYGRIILLCTQIDAVPIVQETVIDRVIFQSKLWDVFDPLFFDGLDPTNNDGVNGYRRQKLLYYIASVMRHVAVPEQMLHPYEVSTSARELVFGMADLKNVSEFYNMDFPFVHDAVNHFRRMSHLYLYDPKVNFPQLSQNDIQDYLEYKRTLHIGSIAAFEEDAIAITPNLELVPTAIPDLVRSYRISGNNTNRQINFALFRLKLGANALTPDAFQELPGTLESWEAINLPNTPGHLQPGFRVPIYVSCIQCHGPGVVRGFNPRGNFFDPTLIRFTNKPETFSADRNIDYKVMSAECKVLGNLWQLNSDPTTILKSSQSRTFTKAPTVSLLVGEFNNTEWIFVFLSILIGGCMYSRYFKKKTSYLINLF
ncbi:MAG TPA: hypothetical protein VMG59_11665 [Phycisphaerae bacterium]|nr:hypothetical protein [Phycisphaerae bacterium]